MKASNSKNATPAQYLEYLKRRSGVEHARRMRDDLGWRWKPSAMFWTIRHHWLAWVAAALSLILTGVGFAADLRALLG